MKRILLLAIALLAIVAYAHSVSMNPLYTWVGLILFGVIALISALIIGRRIAKSIPKPRHHATWRDWEAPDGPNTDAAVQATICNEEQF